MMNTVPDFLELRVGTRLAPPGPQGGDRPVAVRLGDVGVLAVYGDRATGRSLARALLAQLATQCSPENVRVAIVRHPSLVELWGWATWLPHCRDESRRVGSVPLRLFAASTVDVVALLGDDLESRRKERQHRGGLPPGPGTRHLVVVVDGEYQPSLAELVVDDSLASLGVHVVALLGSRRGELPRVDEGIEVRPDGTARRDSDGAEFTVDAVTADDVVALCRKLTSAREDDTSALLHATIGWDDIVGVADVATIDPARTWRRRSMGELLRAPIGVGVDGGLVWLDLKDSAFGGMGPHGVVVGATGAGLSELLRTLVMSLAVTHPPEQLAFLFGDCWSSEQLVDLDQLPHSSGVVTNLLEDPFLVERFASAIRGEMLRRQRLLIDAGHLPDVDVYAQRHPDGEPLPHLLVIIDGFPDLLMVNPKLVDLFLQVCRIGRWLGIHLVLAMQRLESGKMRALEPHLSYRIALRAYSEGESRAVIGVPDAYHLPSQPGSGYLWSGATALTRFKTAWALAPYQSNRDTQGEVTSSAPAATEYLARDTRPSVLQVVARRLSEGLSESGATRVRRCWLDPPPEALPLDAVLSDPPTNPDSPGTARLVATIGLLDVPEQQRQEPLVWDFTGANGNLVVVGLRGKSTLLRTLIASMALRYAPDQVAFFCVDDGDGSLTPLQDLPHVTVVAPHAEPDRVRRVITDVRALLHSRVRAGRRRWLDSATALFRARAAKSRPREVPGDVFLVIDGWGEVRAAAPDVEDLVVDIAARGPALGLHTVVTATDDSHMHRLATTFGGRIEMQLRDPSESRIDRSRADCMWYRTGLVLLPGGHFGQVAVPRVDGVSTVDDLAAGLSHLIGEVNRRWSAHQGPMV